MSIASGTVTPNRSTNSLPLALKSAAITGWFFMRDALAEQKKNPLSIDDVTAMIAGQIGQLAPMDKETADLFQQLAKKMIEQAGK